MRENKHVSYVMYDESSGLYVNDFIISDGELKRIDFSDDHSGVIQMKDGSDSYSRGFNTRDVDVLKGNFPNINVYKVTDTIKRNIEIDKVSF